MLIVRDPVVADLVLPRFLAPGDTIGAALNMDNVEGAAGTYTATIQARGPVSLVGNASVTQVAWTASSACWCRSNCGAQGLGIANITLNVTGPGGFKVSRGWPIQVRAAQLDVSREEDVAARAGRQLYGRPRGYFRSGGFDRQCFDQCFGGARL
jgi:uncharacterized protein YfaS (alpha-2-macroglobulin family)